ncbi:MAG: undecaprenyl-diphosphatase UppP [Candidatus Nomurabacteria bacterium]|nr:undecaprenyl-diphosphatase UppP [Candidatus Nomurabacteria bacterium]
MILIHSIILGIVEGVTEFLPISSTAHMDIVRTILSIPSSEFIKSFEIIIQLGAILAVAIIYFRKVFSSWKNVKNIIIAFIPTGIIGFILYKLIKVFLLGNIWVEAIAILAGGIIIILFERHQIKQNEKEDETNLESLNTRQLLTLGIAQALAVIPGVSRSGAVIISGRAIGLNRKLITEFSFLLAVPTMLAATVYDMYKSGFSFSSSEWSSIAMGFIVSFATAFVVIKWLIEYVKKHTFMVFGWYRIVLGILLILALFFHIL